MKLKKSVRGFPPLVISKILPCGSCRYIIVHGYQNDGGWDIQFYIRHFTGFGGNSCYLKRI
jgi:hypothetical protein